MRTFVGTKAKYLIRGNNREIIIISHWDKQSCLCIIILYSSNVMFDTQVDLVYKLRFGRNTYIIGIYSN